MTCKSHWFSPESFWFSPESFWRVIGGVKRHSARFPVLGEDPVEGSRRTGRNAPLGTTKRQTELQRGIRKDLWPKYFPKCPVARHFVCYRRSMSDAISNILSTCIYRTRGRVGFARGGKLLLKITNLDNRTLPPESNSALRGGDFRGIELESFILSLFNSEEVAS